MWWSRGLALGLVSAIAAMAASSPVEFGLSEFQAAQAARKWPVKVKTELSLDAPESYRIEVYPSGGGRVTGGDLRGLMYGLIEAAGEMKSLGHLKPAKGAPAMALRAVRFKITQFDLDQEWFQSEGFWRNYFQILARSRFNRVNITLARLTESPTHVCMLSQLATSYGLEFTLGLPEPTGDAAGVRARVSTLLAACPLIRGIEMDAGMAPLELYKEGVLRAVETAGRRVTFDLHGAADRLDLMSMVSQAASEFLLPVRVSSATGCKDVTGLPEGSCYWSLHESAGVDADTVRGRMAGILADGAAGFEIDALREENNWHEPFYWTWGRIAYDSKSPAQAPAPKLPVASPVKPSAVPKPAATVPTKPAGAPASKGPSTK